MSGKKGGIAIGEIRGILIFTIAVIIAGLFFYGCSVFEAKKDYEQLQFSKEEVRVNRELNYILEKPVAQEKTVADVILDFVKQLYLDGDMTKFTDAIDEYVKGYFSEYYRFLILNDVGGCLYDSQNRGCLYRESSYFPIAEGVSILPVPFDNGFQYIEVALQSVTR